MAKVTGTNKDDTSARAPKKRAEKKIYPNDPCPWALERNTSSAAAGRKSDKAAHDG